MYRSIKAPLACAAAVAMSTAVLVDGASAQEAKTQTTPLPPVVVEQSAIPAPAKRAKKKVAAKAKPAQPASVAIAPATVSTGVGTTARSGSLSVPNTAEARAEIQQTPGGVELVPDTAYKASTPASTIKDVLDYVPGVFVQPKWGDDSRLSIRGSGLSRNFHLRGLQLFMDGIPINTSDGFGDFQEIDPTAYRYVEVYRGANALRYGGNSLGGAINFVMPTGYDADAFGTRVNVGSFGFHKLAVSSGGVAGPADYFITGTWQETDGDRDHSWGESVRGSFNVGYRLSENIETRFYINANWVRQRIPGEVTKESALTTPEKAKDINVVNDWQRNIDTVRIANKTSIRLAPGTLLEVGAFNVDRHLMHPIFLWLDNTFNDYGGFARVSDWSRIGGYANQFIAGVNLINGENDNRYYLIGPDAAKGGLLQSSIDRSANISAYVENSFYFLPATAFVLGTQFLHATRERDEVYNRAAGKSEFDLWSPKAGLLWNVDPGWQIFGNVSRSAEIPSFGENTITTGFDTKAQRATTYEMGTRGRRRDFTWDLAVYHANVDDELQCLNAFTGDFCVVVNADKTVHQGVEAGFGAALWRSTWAQGVASDAVWLNAAYTLNDFHFRNDASFGDNELPGVPRHYLRAELLYKHRSGVYVGPNVEWVPDAYFVDNANTSKTAAYTLWGAKLGFDNGGPWSAYVEGRNLADTAYISSTNIIGDAKGLDLPLFNPGNGRAFYAGVQYKW